MSLSPPILNYDQCKLFIFNLHVFCLVKMIKPNFVSSYSVFQKNKLFTQELLTAYEQGDVDQIRFGYKS